MSVVLSSGALITVDTAMSWISAGYNHPTVYLYGDFELGSGSKNIIPPNKNGIIIMGEHCNKISLEKVIQLIKRLTQWDT